MTKVNIDKTKEIEITENKLTTIIGPNSLDKTLLAKKIKKELNDTITINEKNNLKDLENLKKELNIDELIKCNYEQLSCGQKAIINIYKALLTNKSILIFDDAFNSIDKLKKEKIFKLLKKLTKQITIINITNDVEETIYGDYVILIDNEKVILNEKTKNALIKEKEFKNCDLDLPFMASLSLKLKYYDLIDNIYLDMNKLVDKLWK